MRAFKRESERKRDRRGGEKREKRVASLEVRTEGGGGEGGGGG